MVNVLRKFVKWLWGTWETFGLLRFLAAEAAGSTPMPIVGVFADWPVWMQALASGGVAFVWLGVLTWLIRFFSKPKPAPLLPPAEDKAINLDSPGAVAVAGPGNATAKDHSLAAGRDIVITQIGSQEALLPTKVVSGPVRTSVPGAQFGLSVAGAVVALTAPPKAAAAEIYVRTASVVFTRDGSAPTATRGFQADPADIIVLDSRAELDSFRAIRQGATATVDVEYFGPVDEAHSFRLPP
jgi:hypothetical protein